MEPEIVLLRGIFPLWQSEYFLYYRNNPIAEKEKVHLGGQGITDSNPFGDILLCGFHILLCRI